MLRGMCNEYSAQSFVYHMGHINSSEPIIRHWAERLGHSFTTVGDSRERAVLTDGWPINHQSGLLSSSDLVNYPISNIQTWAARMGWEGPQVIADQEQRTRSLFEGFELSPHSRNLNLDLWAHQRLSGILNDHPNFQTFRARLLDANAADQRSIVANYESTGELPSWVYNYRTNFSATAASSNATSRRANHDG